MVWRCWLLVVEVAESSLAYDCGEKADLYAAVGITDYWVINLPPVRSKYVASLSPAAIAVSRRTPVTTKFGR